MSRHKPIGGYWTPDHPLAKGFGFEEEWMAALMEAMCESPDIRSCDEAMRVIKPVFRILGIKSKWSE